MVPIRRFVFFLFFPSSLMFSIMKEKEDKKSPDPYFSVNLPELEAPNFLGKNKINSYEPCYNAWLLSDLLVSYMFGHSAV